MRAEVCACGVTLRFPLDDRSWTRLMLAHVQGPSHQLWRVRQGTFEPHIYEEHLPPVRRVA